MRYFSTVSTCFQAGNVFSNSLRSQETKLIPLNSADVAFLIVNSNVKHQLADSEYASRRNDTIEAARRLNVRSLRYTMRSSLDSKRSRILQHSTYIHLPDCNSIERGSILYRRALHCITEIERTYTAAEALLERNDYEHVGRLMNESHISLRSLCHPEK